MVVALDLSKAFDMVNHDILLEEMYNSTLPGSLVRWFATYLHGRQSKVYVQGSPVAFEERPDGGPPGNFGDVTLFV